MNASGAPLDALWRLRKDDLCAELFVVDEGGRSEAQIHINGRLSVCQFVPPGADIGVVASSFLATWTSAGWQPVDAC